MSARRVDKNHERFPIPTRCLLFSLFCSLFCTWLLPRTKTHTPPTSDTLQYFKTNETMSHITGWEDDMMHRRNAITSKRMARLMRRETKRQQARRKLEQEQRLLERAAMELEFKNFHIIAIMETLSQIPKPMPKKSMFSKFVDSITPSWMQTANSKDDDILSTATMETEYSEDLSVSL